MTVGEPDVITVNRAALNELVTGVWRLRQHLAQPDAGNQEAAQRQLGYILQDVWNALARAQVQVQQHTGDRYVPGMLINVLAFEPAEGIEHETIGETLKPSIYHQETLIQVGEVIVHTPVKPDDVAGSEPAPPEDVDTGNGMV